MQGTFGNTAEIINGSVTDLGETPTKDYGRKERVETRHNRRVIEREVAREKRKNEQRANPATTTGTILHGRRAVRQAA